MTDHPTWIVDVEQDGAERVPPHWADSVGHDQPPRVGLDRGSGVADLHQLPGVGRQLDQFGMVPEADLIRPHQVVALPVASGEGSELPADETRKDGYPLVPGGPSVEGGDPKASGIGRLYELREDIDAVEGRVGCVIDNRPARVDELDQSGIFDGAALGRADREQHPLGYVRLLWKRDLIVRRSQPVHHLDHALDGSGRILLSAEIGEPRRGSPW